MSSFNGFAMAGIGMVTIGTGVVMCVRGLPYKGATIWGAGHVLYGAGMLTDNFHSRTPLAASVMLVSVTLIVVGVILLVRDLEVIRSRERGN